MPKYLPDLPLDQQVLDVFSRQLWYRPTLQVKTCMHLSHDLGFDSLDLVELTVRLECHFRIEIADEELTEWNTVGDVMTCVQHHLIVRELLAEQQGTP
jgi:acyl carrier protein